MNKSVEEYLKILYPNIDSLNEEEQKKYEKDKNFLLEFWNEFNEEYNKYFDQINNFGEYEFTSTILQMCKERLDKETIIIDYANSMFKMLNENSYISNNFDSFMSIMHYERAKEEQLKDYPLDMTPIDLETVFALTEEFLSQIDDSQELIAEFIKLKKEGKIIVHSHEDTEKRSVYKNGKINYVFDGTVNSAHTLLHEFMHHWIEIKAHPNSNREEHTMFNEFESIYYENAFIQFMNNKGLLKSGEEPLKAVRLQREYLKDPNNCIIMLLELCQDIKNNGTINKDSIINMLKKHMPNITNHEELWANGSKMLSEFCNEHIFEGETINGPVMYRFNTGLAMQTSLDQRTIRNIYKLIPFLKDRIQDDIFMEQYMLAKNSKETTQIQRQISTTAFWKESISVDPHDKSLISRIFEKWKKPIIEMEIFKKDDR